MLQTLALLDLPLRQLLCLLLMPRLRLLSLLFAGILPRHLLVLLFLLALQLLTFFILLREQFVLFLLVLPVAVSVARVGRYTLRLLKLIGMNRATRLPTVSRGIVSSASLFCVDNSMARKLCRPWGRRDWWLAMIGSCPQLRISASIVQVLRLRSY